MGIISIYVQVNVKFNFCRLLIKIFYNIINRSSPPTTNHFIYTKINIIAKNPVSADFAIQNNRNVNFNLRRKVTRMKNKERLDQLGQTTNNDEDTNFTQKIFSHADKKFSTVLDPDSKEMKLWKIHCEFISSVNKSCLESIAISIAIFFKVLQ